MLRMGSRPSDSPPPGGTDEQFTVPRPIGVPEVMPFLGEGPESEIINVPFQVPNPDFVDPNDYPFASLPTDVDNNRFVGIQYRDGDEIVQFSGLGQVDRARIQLMLEDAGLLPTGYLPGEWDSQTQAAMRVVMAESNVSGRTWDEQLPIEVQKEAERLRTAEEEAARQQLEDFIPDVFERNVFLAPDYASLAQAAKNTIRSQLGREPKDYEVTLLAQKMASDSRAAFDASEQVRRLQHEAANHARLEEFEAGQPLEAFTLDPDGNLVRSRFEDAEGTGTAQVLDPDGNLVEVPLDPASQLPDAVGGGTVQGVDAQARFAESFERTFANELDLIRKKAGVQQSTSALMSGLAGIRGRVAGGR